jgi:membrane-associated phospholipid phosphatase
LTASDRVGIKREVTRRLRIITALSVVCCVVGARPGHAADARQSAYRLSFELDASLLLVAGGVASSFLFMSEANPPACAPLCDRSNINPLDRPFAGIYDERWQLVGDISTISTLVLVPAGLLLGEPSRAGLKDLLVVGEALLVTSAIQVSASYMVNRPRPRVYGEEAPLDERNDPNAGRSFFSGHAANCLAGTIVTAVALRRIGSPRLAWAVLAVGLSGSALVGFSRVAAGGHFPSDVVIGYAIGVGVGIAIPALHGLSLQATPLALPGTAGLSIAGRF